jgi:hypothetical protein
MNRSARSFLPIVLSVLAAACARSSEDQPPPESSPEPVALSVTITNPTEGAVLEEPQITVWLESTVPIVPAGDMTPGTGHHHLYLDADLGDMTQPIPDVPGSIVHMGNAAREYVFENAASGEHRLIAVVADGAHVPLQPLVADTVHFIVE